MTPAHFRVGLSGDFRAASGELAFDAQAWQALQDAPGVEVEVFDRPIGAAIRRADAERFDALIIKRNPVAADVLEGPLRLRLIARNGVGFDHIDVAACTRSGVIVTLTPQATTRPVASSVIALMLAFAHRLLQRDRSTRAGQWSRRWDDPGFGLTGRTLGVVGLGNIGREVLRLAAPWKMRHLGFAPRPRHALYAGLEVELASLDTLLARSDFVALCCPLNERTRGMIDARALALMKPDAILINTARGEIVDEPALVDALRARRIGGAGLDVFAQEPPAADHPLFALDNVVLASHNLAHTDESIATANRAVAAAVADVARGRVPSGILDAAALSHPRLQPLSTGA
jgi:D-3-phosphoglycerate dehydrogenase